MIVAVKGLVASHLLRAHNIGWEMFESLMTIVDDSIQTSYDCVTVILRKYS